MPKFKKGDVVVLKCGGCAMVVVGFCFRWIAGGNEDLVNCVSPAFAYSERQFPAEALVFAKYDARGNELTKED